MANAYTPGLKIVGKTLVEKDRKLPLKGNVHVKSGDKVLSETVVASTELPGAVHPLNIANVLGCEPKEINLYLTKKEGDKVEKDEVIAETGGFFGWFKSYARSPISGFIESLSSVTGQAMLREPPKPFEVKAYVDGIVTKVFENEGVEVNTLATFIQGIFGIGGEVVGELIMAVDSPDAVLDADCLKLEHKGKIVVGGSLVTAAALKRAVELGVKGVIAGGYDAQDLKEFLGYDLGVAITGTEDKGVTLVVTEGFGQIAMAHKTFELLKGCVGKKCSINGATQIRAGVIRPEVIIPLPEQKIDEQYSQHGTGMQIGTMVRVIRQPSFGEVAKVVELPEQPVIIQSEAKVRVVKIKIVRTGEEITLPRANVEIIEE